MLRKVKLVYVDFLFPFSKDVFVDRKVRISHQWLECGSFGTKSSHIKEALYIQAKNRLFMRESKDFSTSDSQLQLLSDRGHCAEYSYLYGQLSPRAKGGGLWKFFKFCKFLVIRPTI